MGMGAMIPPLALAAHAGARLAETGLLPAPVPAVVDETSGGVLTSRWSRFRLNVAGILLAAAWVLLIATH